MLRIELTGQPTDGIYPCTRETLDGRLVHDHVDALYLLEWLKFGNIVSMGPISYTRFRFYAG